MRFQGTRYVINRGEIDFTNPFRIEPVLDFELETRIRDVDIALNISGPARNMNLSYRSDPPLEFNQLVSLIAVGRSPTTDPVLAAQERVEAQPLIQAGANTLLSQALSRPFSKGSAALLRRQPSAGRSAGRRRGNRPYRADLDRAADHQRPDPDLQLQSGRFGTAERARRVGAQPPPLVHRDPRRKRPGGRRRALQKEAALNADLGTVAASYGRGATAQAWHSRSRGYCRRWRPCRGTSSSPNRIATWLITTSRSRSAPTRRFRSPTWWRRWSKPSR